MHRASPAAVDAEPQVDRPYRLFKRIRTRVALATFTRHWDGSAGGFTNDELFTAPEDVPVADRPEVLLPGDECYSYGAEGSESAWTALWPTFVAAGFADLDDPAAAARLPPGW